MESGRGDFKKTHPNVTVKIQNIVTTSESTYYAKLDLLERSSSTSPNIVYEDSFLVKSDAAAGYLAPMPQLKSFSEWKAEYPTFQAMTEYNGTPYSMMSETDVQQLYLRQACSSRRVCPSTWKPTSLNYILTAAEAIKAKDPGVIPLWIYTGTPLGEASSFRGFEVLLPGPPAACTTPRPVSGRPAGPASTRSSTSWPGRAQGGPGGKHQLLVQPGRRDRTEHPADAGPERRHRPRRQLGEH